MIWRHLKLAIIVVVFVGLIANVIAPLFLLEKARRTAIADASEGFERSAAAVESAFNRQILQVDGALATLPTLFAAANALPDGSSTTVDLLRSLDFQTLAYRDLLIASRDGTILAAARQRQGHGMAPVATHATGLAQTDVAGPVRNPMTGEWSVYVVRQVPEWPGLVVIAEVPLNNLMALLSETGLPPETELRLERRSGQLLAALPHDEVGIGKIAASPALASLTSGKASVIEDAAGAEQLVAARHSLYSDIDVVLLRPLGDVLAGWFAEKVQTLWTIAIRGGLILAFGFALVFGLRQRDRAEAERSRSAEALAAAVEAMPGGFCIWDEDDRFVTCNQHYRDVYAASVPFMIPGAPHEEVLRKGLAVGQYPQAGEDHEAFVQQTLEFHRNATGSIERLMPDGRWVLLQDRRMAKGGTVGIRTDITPIKTALVELAEANLRALGASEEASRQNRALREREQQIRFLAHHDDLTGLPNRALLRERIAASGEAARHRGGVALLYLDLDRFKEVNDTLGHHVGDALLRSVADRLRRCTPEADTVARLGGDEFAVLITEPTDLAVLAERIITTLGQPCRVLGHTIATSASVGIAVDEKGDADSSTLLQRADLALYEAKSRGGATACSFVSEMEARLRERLEIEADLRGALAGGQFRLVYQPVIDLASRRIVGFEALLRWDHPRRGAVEPSSFIKIAEDTGLIVDVGAFVLRRACSDIAAMGGDIRVAANLSPVQLAHGDFPATVADVLRDTGLEPSRLELEITETTLLADTERNLEAVRRLKQLGVRIVLDDFGVGYSSLSHLRQFALDKIKIDRSFVSEMPERPDSAIIVRAVAALARDLGMTTTAEGVETTEQLEMVRCAGCVEAQGYLLGRPAPISNWMTVETPVS